MTPQDRCRVAKMALAHKKSVLPSTEERRRFQRVKVHLLGRYMLPDRREFPCQIINMSPGGLALLAPATRAIGMGIFYTLYYATMMLGPVVGGACAKWAGSTGAAFDFGAAVLLMCPVLLWGFNRMTQAAAVKAA